MTFKIRSVQLQNFEVVFFVSYVAFIALMMLRTTLFSAIIGETAYKLIAVLCLLLLAIKEYLNRYQPIPLLIYLIFLALFVIIINKNAYFLSTSTVFFLYAGRDIDFKKIAKITICVELVLLLVVISCSLVGIIENYQYEMNTTRPREFLGFLYALYPQAFMTNIAGLYFYVKRENARLLDVFVLEVINIWIYLKTNSRLTFILTTVLLLSILVYKAAKHFRYNRYNGIIKKVVAAGFIFSFVICYIGSIWIHIRYNPAISWMARINRVLVNRLYYGNKSYIQYGITWLGQHIYWTGNGLEQYGGVSTGEYLYVDNLYLQFSQRYGLLLAIILLIAITYTLYTCWRNRDYVLLFIFGTIAVHALIDDLVMHIWYNTFWFVVAQAVFVNEWRLSKKHSKKEIRLCRMTSERFS